MPYRIVIAEEEFALAQQLKQKVESLSHDVVGIAENCTKLTELVNRCESDLIIMDEKLLGTGPVDDIMPDSQGSPLPIIISLSGDAESVKCATQGNVMAYFVRPISPAHLRASIDLAMARFGEIQLLKREVDDLQTAIAHRKVIERAKGILMDHCRMTECEAFRKLQLLSQRENRPMVEIAESVITTHCLLKEQGIELDELADIHSR